MEKMAIIKKTGAILALLLLLTSGCARHDRTNVLSVMSTLQIDELKSRLGVIGITNAQHLPHIFVQTPSKGAKEGAKEGAKAGGLAPIEMSYDAWQVCRTDIHCFALPFVGIALSPVGAVVGGVGGAITADSADKVTGHEIKVKNALANLPIQENMRDKFISRLSDLKTFPVTVIPDAGPAMEGEKPDYRQFKSRGIGSVNEIEVRNLELSGPGKVRPNLYVRLEVQVRLILLEDNSEKYCKVFMCSSQADEFENWAAEDAKKFREEIESCFNDVADWSVQDLYVNDAFYRMPIGPISISRTSTRRAIAACQ